MGLLNSRVLSISGIDMAKCEVEKIDRNSHELKIFSEKAICRAIKIIGLDARAANLLRQEALIIGAEAVISPEVTMFSAVKSDVIVLANLYQYKNLYYGLQNKGFGLDRVGEEIKKVLLRYDGEYPLMKKGKYSFNFNDNKYIMGILNITPDSFSDGGKYNNAESALKRAVEMKEEGADIIDIGAESTRPGAESIGEQEELDRIMPIVEKIVKEVDIAVSIDTYKSKIAEETLKAGAVIINDITGLKGDKKMAEIVSDNDAIAVLMHMQGNPKNMQENPVYDDLIGDICIDLKESIKLAEMAGIKNENIIVDPGIGFGKTASQNYEILKKLNEFKSLGYPILVGTSRKSFIGKALDKDAQNRIFGSLATATIALKNGASIVRVHDVKETKQVIKIVQCIENGGK